MADKPYPTSSHTAAALDRMQIGNDAARLVRRNRHAIGIDLGGTQLRVACVDGGGRILALERVRSDDVEGRDALIQQMAMLVQRVRSRQVEAIGVGIPGSINRREGLVLGIPAFPGWSGVPLAGLLQNRVQLPVYLENDANVAALGEWRSGAGMGSSDVAYVTISTGIGAGIISDGRLVRGFGGLAGEIGHTRLTDNSPPCSCGQIGCFEAVASGKALDRKVADAVAQNPSSILAQLAAGQAPRAEHLAEAVRRADPRAQDILDEEAVLLGIGFTNLQHLYSPERIVVGGGVSALLPLMRETIERIMKDRLLAGFTPAQLRVAELGDSAGVIGAAGLALDAAFESESG
jgi:glucokinase